MGLRLHVLLLIGDDADGPAADARVAAKHSLAVLSAVFLEFAGVHYARNDFAHVILLGRIAGKNAVDFVSREERVARNSFTKNGRRSVAHLVDQRPNALEARVIVRLAKIHGAADLRVHVAAAQIFGGSFSRDGG